MGLNARNGFPVFQTHIEANYIAKSSGGWSVARLTDEDRQQITALAADPRIGEGGRGGGRQGAGCCWRPNEMASAVGTAARTCKTLGPDTHTKTLALTQNPGT
jgi:hypothetical protein